MTKEKLEYHRKWRAENREKCNLASREWKERNPDKVREHNQKYYDSEYQKLWAQQNRPKRKVIEEKWRKANKELVLIGNRRRNRRYDAAHPEKKRIQSQRRRERIRNTKSCDKASANLLCQLISSTSRLKCGICGKNMPKNDRTIDHVIPLSKGGSGEIWNLRIVHLVCNLKKGQTMPEELLL